VLDVFEGARQDGGFAIFLLLGVLVFLGVGVVVAVVVLGTAEGGYAGAELIDLLIEICAVALLDGVVAAFSGLAERSRFVFGDGLAFFVLACLGFGFWGGGG